MIRLFNKSAHVLIGFYAGYIFEEYPQKAMTILAFFGFYQGVEYLRIRDTADVDVKEAGVGFGAGLAVYKIMKWGNGKA